MTWTLFGKIPREGDFVRHGARAAIDVECFEWIAAAVARGPAWVRAIPETGIRFLFPGSRADGALIGVMVRSCDRVGRDFPIVAVHAIGRASDRSSVALPVAWAGPLLGARRALDRAGSRRLEETIAVLDGARVPSEVDVQNALARCTHALQSTSVGELHARLFEDPDEAHYAYHAMRAAARAAGSPGAPAVLCPLGVAGDLVAWLELVRRLVPPQPRPTACAWSIGCAAVSHGEMAPAALPALLGHDGGSSMVWPLSTESAAARARARTEIGPLMPPSSAPVLAMIEALGRRTS